MKFRITEPTFFLHKDRKPGEELDAPVGPIKPVRANTGQMQYVPQFEVIPPVQQPPTLPPNELAPKATPMSITGIQSGAFQAKLAEMRKKIADKQTEALTKIDGAVTSGAAKMHAAVDDVIAKADKEVDAALHEFAQFTNGGPA